MVSFVEALYKSKDTIQLGWSKEPEAVASYKLYVGLAPVVASMNLFAINISPQASQLPGSRGKVIYDVAIADVRTLLSLVSTVNFSNIILYWTITWVNAAGTESAITDSTIVEVPPAGIDPKTRKDDPTVNRNIYGFSDELLKWIKASASSKGALIVDTSDYFKANITTEYTYDGTDVATMKSYLTDRTAAGSPAKLTTYEYSGGAVTKVSISDSTV